MSTLFRRCGCRRADGRAFGVLPEKATLTQRDNACPRLLRDSKHGSWGFAVSKGVDSSVSKRVQVRKMGFTVKRDAQQALAAAIGSVRPGHRSSNESQTLGSWLPAWLVRRERDGLRAATLAGYRRYIEKDISPALGHLKLREVRRHHVDSFLQILLENGRGITTVHRIHAVLSSSFSLAYRLDLVPANPAAQIALPRERAEKVRVWEPAQVRAFLDFASSYRLAPLFELVIRTGLRRGEVAGLRWADVDLERGRLVVRQQRVQVDTVVVTNAAKTDHGQERRVTLDQVAVRELRRWRQRACSVGPLAG